MFEKGFYDEEIPSALEGIRLLLSEAIGCFKEREPEAFVVRLAMSACALDKLGQKLSDIDELEGICNETVEAAELMKLTEHLETLGRR